MQRTKIEKKINFDLTPPSPFSLSLFPSHRFAEQKDAAKKLKESMKTLQSEMEIQEQVVEVVERNMRMCEGKAAAEEEEAAVCEMEMECVRVKVESEREKAKGMEEEEGGLKEAISKAQALERKLQKEGVWMVLFLHTKSLSIVFNKFISVSF